MAKAARIVGPDLKKVMKLIQKDSSRMIESGLKESTRFIEKEAKERASNINDDFKKFIRHNTQLRAKKNIATSQIGIVLNSPAFASANSIEQKHKIFRELEASKKNDVKNLFITGINNHWKRKRFK